MSENGSVLSRAELVTLVERASNLEERIHGPFVPVDTGVDALVERRLERWRMAVAKGDDAAFQRYLEWRGLDPDRARRVLGAVRWAGGETLPAWAGEVNAVLALLGDPVAPSDAEAAGSVFAPFVARVEAMLRADVVADPAIVSPGVFGELAGALLAWLRVLAGPTLDAELTFRASGLTAATRGQDRAAPLEEFARHLASGGWRELLLEYPALARLLGTAMSNVRSAMRAFLTRFLTDRPAIVETIFSGEDPGALTGVHTRLSDPHNGGQTAIGLVFANGAKLIYKPRSCGLEAAYFDLLAWMNAGGCPVPFRVLRVLDRRSHGWVEWVEHAPCRDAGELRRFAASAGAVLAVAHLLQMNDLHAENLIASGPDAVLVDLETAAAPEALPLSGADAEGAASAAGEALAASVLRSSLLPSEMELAGRPHEIGALVALTGRPPLDPRASPVPLPAEPGEPLPLPVPPAESVEIVAEAFASVYRWLLGRREALLADGGPLAAFGALPVRLVFRNTSVYHAVALRSFQAAALRDGVDRSLELEVLNRPLRHHAGPPPQFPVFRAEVESLERLDVPYFDARTDGDTVVCGDGTVVGGCLRGASYRRVVDRFRAWGESDLALQLDLIRISLAGRGVGALHERGPLEAGHGAGDDAATPPGREPDRDALIGHAAGIVAALRARALAAGDGTVAWVGPVVVPGRSGVRPALLPLGLEDGVGGVVLFLAGFAALTGDGDARRLAGAAWRWIDCLARQESTSVHWPLDAVGSAVYALVRAGELLDDGEPISIAGRMAARWLMGGASSAGGAGAGAGGEAAAAHAVPIVHGLLALAEHGERPGCVDAAVAWGRVAAAAALRGPEPPDVRGDAGVALALARVFRATGDTGALLAAVAAAGRVADRLEATGAACRSAHAGSAVILALELAGRAPDARLVDVATAAARLQGDAVDTLCCGTAGRVDALISLGRLLGDPGLHGVATRRAGHLLGGTGPCDVRPTAPSGGTGEAGGPARHGRRAGHVRPPLRFHPGIPPILWSPALLHGAAGIGYVLLRLAAPATLPAVTLWE